LLYLATVVQGHLVEVRLVEIRKEMAIPVAVVLTGLVPVVPVQLYLMVAQLQMAAQDLVVLLIFMNIHKVNYEKISYLE
jgi:hypothetical protein